MPRGAEFDARWERLEAEGMAIHGEADLVASFRPRTVLDAGCGTGRVAIELARRGIDVVGVDLDEVMLAAARAKAPDLRWVHHDLRDVTVVAGPDTDAATDDPPRRFDLVVLAGNVVIFLAPGTEADVVANLTRHLAPGGLLVAGFSLGPRRSGAEVIDLAAYDACCAAAGLELVHRWSTWDQAPFTPSDDYAVSVHARPR